MAILDELGEWSYLGDVKPPYYKWVSTGINVTNPSRILRIGFRDLPLAKTYTKVRIRGIISTINATLLTQSKIIYPSAEKQVIELAFPETFVSKSQWVLGVEVMKLKLKRWSLLEPSEYTIDIENYNGLGAVDLPSSFDDSADFLAGYLANRDAL
jgi:hypothetical protein